MIKGHTTHSLDEMKSMVDEIIKSGKEHHIKTPCLDAMTENVAKFTVK